MRRNYAIHSSYITCCKTSLPWVDKTYNMYRFFCKKKNLSLLSAATLIPRPRQQPDLLQDRFDSWVVKSLFNSFCNNITKQVALFAARFTVPYDQIQQNFQISFGKKLIKVPCASTAINNKIC